MFEKRTYPDLSDSVRSNMSHLFLHIDVQNASNMHKNNTESQIYHL